MKTDQQTMLQTMMQRPVADTDAAADNDAPTETEYIDDLGGIDEDEDRPAVTEEEDSPAAD